MRIRSHSGIGPTAILLALLSGPAAAAPSALSLFEEAKKTFELGQFQRSLELFSRARRGARDERLIADIELNLGVNHAVLGDERQARIAFEQALRYDPTVTLDPNRHKPAIVRIFRRVRASLRGQLKVSGGPPGAEVVVDGAVVGPIPFLGPLRVGRHTLEVRDARGKALLKQQMVVSPDRTVVVTLRERGRPTTTTRASKLFAQPTIKRNGRRRPRLLWTWVAAGGAVVAAAVGIGFGIAAKKDHDEYMTTDDPRRFDELADRIPGRATTANVMFGLAGALTAGAAVLFFVERRRASPPEETAIAPDLGPKHWGLSLRRHF